MLFFVTKPILFLAYSIGLVWCSWRGIYRSHRFFTGDLINGNESGMTKVINFLNEMKTIQDEIDAGEQMAELSSNGKSALHMWLPQSITN